MSSNRFLSGIEHDFWLGWAHMAKHVNETAREKGWWDGERNDGECIVLMHSELSEALEALRHGNPPSEKAAGFSAVEEELADVVIRIMDFAAQRGYDIGGAILGKATYNDGRPHMHGGKLF